MTQRGCHIQALTYATGCRDLALLYRGVLRAIIGVERRGTILIEGDVAIPNGTKFRS